MDRTEKTGLALAIIGHVLLFGLLSASLLWRRPPPATQAPMDVTLSTVAAMESAAPVITQQPAQSQAPEVGAPEEAADAAPPQPTEAEPKPAPPQPAPPKPAPKPAPAQKPKPAPEAKPAPQSKPQPTKKSAPAAKPAPATTKSQGHAATPAKPHERGSHLGADFLKGITAEKSDSRVQAPRAAKVGAQDIANIADLIKRQVQPCYDLGALAGTSAMDIVTVLRLQFRRDGSVAAATVSEQDGVNGSNQRYATQMADLSRRAVLRCSPLKGLPADLYDNGWRDFDMGFIPRQLG